MGKFRNDPERQHLAFELMERYIALLRGINVSGQKMIKMEELKKAMEELEFSNVRTYIQSGNILFENEKSYPSLIAEKIAGKILNRFGFDVPVIIRTLQELESISRNNPYSLKRNEDVSSLHVTFLAGEPDPEKVKEIGKNMFLPDEFFISGKEIYLFCPNGYSRTKLTNTFFESKMKTTATTRNWKTIQTLLTL